jgi:tetratricopeptide (TPR) repeat protein
MRRLVALLLVAALLAATAFADRQSAVFFATRADKSLASKDFTGAEENYRKALAEDAAFHPARYGLAQALLGLGRSGPALEELKKFVADVKADAAAPADWKALLAKAEKQFADMDSSAAEIQKLVDKYADDLVALAKKWVGKDPSVAKRAAKRALALRPGDPQAAEIAGKVEDAANGPPVVLFNGVDLKNWEMAEFPYWQILNDVIVADVREGSREMRTQMSFDGDFDVRMEARITQEKVGQDTMIALLGGYHGENDFEGLGLINRKVYFFDRTSQKDKRIIVKTPVTEWTKPFDPAAWNKYELRFRGDKITALINGEVVAEDARTERRASGFIALYAQSATVGFRNVEVQRR